MYFCTESENRLLKSSFPILQLVKVRTRVYVTLMRLAGDVVFLADELVVIQHVEFLARAQLLATHHTRKAVQVKHFISRLAYQVARRDTLRTASAFRAVPPARKHNTVKPRFTNLIRS
jgi:hypothetical protein